MPPWLLVAVLVSLLGAVGYQIVRVKALRLVPLYWLVIFCAFLACEAGADSVHLHSLQLGELQLLPDIGGVLLALAALRLARL